MLKIDYTLYPGKVAKKNDFEIDENQKPVVSIITPYYNGEKYIDETVNCILNQTFPYWEWIIVDDGSTEEKSIKKLKEIEQTDKRIKVLHKENEGTAAARDFGVQNTEKMTKYLLFIDSDDIIDRTYIECCYWTLENNKDATWAYSDLIGFGVQEYIWRKWYNPEWEQNENILVVTSFVRKKEFEAVGGFGYREKKIYEDWCLWLKLIKQGKFPVRISSLLTWYRIKQVVESEYGKSKTENIGRALELVNEIKKDISETKPGIQYPKKDDKCDEIIENQPNIIIPKQKRNNKKNVLLFISCMEKEYINKDILELLSKTDEYEFTLISTMPSTNELRQNLEQYATIYDLTSFLDKRNWISFINYIINKCNIDIINVFSEFGYNMLPYLENKHPNIQIIDEMHKEKMDMNKELIKKYFNESNDKYRYLANKFNIENIHILEEYRQEESLAYQKSQYPTIEEERLEKELLKAQRELQEEKGEKEELKSLNNQIVEQLSQKNTQIEELQKQLKQNMENLNYKENELQCVYSSKGWKMIEKARKILGKKK